MRDYKTAVVIPCYKTWDLCQQLLDNLEKHEGDNIDEIIVVNDDPNVSAGRSRELLSSNLNLRILKNDINLGFTLTCNLGLSAACHDLSVKKLVFLISTDVKVGGKFVEQTADIVYGGGQFLVGNRRIDWDTGWNTFNGLIFEYLEGWFLAATNKVWKDVGYFDPAYAPYDMEDIDIATTAKERGHKLISLNNPYLVHLGGGTIGFNPAREAITIRNKEYFRKKWLPE
jgi:GT2 family glycosyltransferase